MIIARERIRHEISGRTPLEDEIGHLLKKHINSLTAQHVEMITSATKKAETMLQDEDRAVLRVQCAWRGKKGRFAAHLKRTAERQMKAKEDHSVLVMQRLLRGYIGRRRFKKFKEKQHKEECAKRTFVNDKPRKRERNGSRR